MRVFRWIIPALVVALILSTGGLVSAQEAGAISGTVTDAQTRDPIQGALVEVEATEPPLSAETGVDGTYLIPNMSPGQYTVTVSAVGYEGEKETGVDVSDAESAVVDFALGLEDSEDESQEADADLQPITLDGESETGKGQGDPKGYVGAFSLGVGFFTVTTKKEEVTIRIPDGGLEPITRIRGRAAATVEADGSTVDALLDGAEVAVLVEFLLVDSVPDLVPEARQIMVKPTPQAPVVGAIVNIATSDEGIRTLTIMRPNGTTKEVRLGAEVDSPGIGEVVTAFPGRGSKGRGQGEAGSDGEEPPTATGLVSAEQVLQRLESFLEDLTAGNGNLPPQAVERRALQVSQVAAILESHASEHVGILEKSVRSRTCRHRRYWACSTI